MNRHSQTRRDDDLDAEIQAHLRMAKGDRMDRGESPQDAEANSRREFGNLTLVKEVTREVWGWGSLERLWQDVRHGARGFIKNPIFTIAAILSIGLGIGANTAIFAVISSIFLSPLPVHDPATLAGIFAIDNSGKNLLPVSYLNWKDLRARNQAFSDVAAFSSTTPVGLARTSNAVPERIFAELATANYFEVLGISPVRGRFFAKDEDQQPHPVVVLGYALWQQRFGAAEDLIGQPIRLNNVPFTVIGVAPEGFKGVTMIFGPDVWVPSSMAEQIFSARGHTWLHDRSSLSFRLAGRLNAGATVAQADANARAIWNSLEKEFLDPNKQRTLTVRPITEAAFSKDQRDPFLFGSVVLMAITGLVLLIACSNVGNLLLARAAARRQEMAVRAALGAGRIRLLRQLLTESVMLALISGVAGLGIAYAVVQLVSSFRPADVTRNLAEPVLDPVAFLFAFAISVVAGLIFGIIPALEGSRPESVEALREARATGQGRKVIFQKVLLAGQVAFSLVALITAGLALRSIQRAYEFDPGFETKRAGIILLDPGQAGYNQPRTEQFYREVRARASSVPGVERIALASNLPLWGRLEQGVKVEGSENPATTILNRIDPGYFATAGIPVVQGRDFTAADRDGSLPVAIVNEAMAHLYWPGQDAIGRRLRLSGETFSRQIVGVIKTVNSQSLGEAPRPSIHVPFAQNFSTTMVLYVRTRGDDPTPTLAAVQQQLRRIDSQVPVDDVRPMSKVIDQGLWGARIGVSLLSLFGFLALALASIGLYGVTAYSVNQRQREIGLRMALGASPGTVLRMVLRQTLLLVSTGIAIGLVASFFAAQLLSRLLFGIDALDPVSLAAASCILLLVTLAASYLPARRASRVDPMLALREA